MWIERWQPAGTPCRLGCTRMQMAWIMVWIDNTLRRERISSVGRRIDDAPEALDLASFIPVTSADPSSICCRGRRILRPLAFSLPNSRSGNKYIYIYILLCNCYRLAFEGGCLFVQQRARLKKLILKIIKNLKYLKYIYNFDFFKKS